MSDESKTVELYVVQEKHGVAGWRTQRGIYGEYRHAYNASQEVSSREVHYPETRVVMIKGEVVG